MTPIFGQMCEFESMGLADKQQSIISYFNRKQAEICLLNKKEVEIVIPTKNNEEASNKPFTAEPCFDLNNRLSWIHYTTEDWRFVSCELCFIIKGRREPDHGLDSCEQQPASKPAKCILQQLTILTIPQYYNQKGACSICRHGQLVCNKIRQGESVRQEAYNYKSNSRKANLIKEDNTRSGRDSYYINKPVVRRIIAALYAYNDQILGKILTKITLDYKGINLASENQARRQFKQCI